MLLDQPAQGGMPMPDPAGGQPAPQGPPPMPAPAPVFYDVTTIRRKKYGCARVEPVPPEEFGISRRARFVSEADYCFHETSKSSHDLIAMGFDAAQVKALPTGQADEDGGERQARDTVDESSFSEDAGANWVTRQHRVTEHYGRFDYEEDGKPRLYRITTAGGSNDILKRKGKLAIDEVDCIPFAAMTPVIMPHRFYGRSMADLVMDIQRIKTALLRSLLDNIYLANNQRLEIAESHATAMTIDDILNNRPGGIVRTRQPGGLLPIPNQEIGSYAYPMLEYQDNIREWRTGVTRQGQGIDAKALQNQSATAAAQLFTMAQARMRLVARIFAETGVRDLFLLLHQTIRANDRQSNTVRLRNKWVTVSPQEWQRRKDMTVNVGVATGGKEQQFAIMMQILGIQQVALASGTGLATPENIYHTLKDIVELAGRKSVDPYFTDPAQAQPAQQPPDPKLMAVQAKAESDAKAADAKAQTDQQSAAQKIELEQAKMAQEAMLKHEQMQAEFALRQEQMSREFELKREQLTAELVLKRQLGYLNAGVNAGAKAAANATSPVRLGGMPG